MNPVILIIAVILVLLLALMSYALYANIQDQKKKRALDVIKGQKKAGRSAANSVEDVNKRRADLAKKLEESEKDEKKKAKNKNTIRGLLIQSGLSLSTGTYWILSVACAAFCVLMAFMFGQSLAVMILVGIIGFFGVPRFVLKKIVQRRQKKFLTDFADALEAMVRLLKAGMPVAEAISMVAREFSGPVGEEMAQIYDAQRIGMTLHEAALKAAERMPLPEMKMLATGISIQAQTGASLSEVLQNLASVIRARFKLKRKVVALSSEAKSSAMIIGALPFLIGGAISLINPAHVLPLFETTMGNVVLACSLFWMGIGIIVMKAMINFKV